MNGVQCPPGDLVRVRAIWNPAESDLTTPMVNKGFQARRADMRSGGGAENGGLKPDYVGTTETSYYKYDYRSCLLVPPFKTFNTDIYARSPSWLPYIDSLDLMLSFKTPNEVKAALFQAASMLEGGNSYKIQNWDIGLYKQPYLEVEWCVPPVQLRPQYVIPSWRNTHYSQRITFPAADDYKLVTFQNIRLDSLSSLISVHTEDSSATKVQDDQTATWRAQFYNWVEYYAPMKDLTLTLNERLNQLADKDLRQMWQLFRTYAPDSRMDFTTWRELRQVYLVRSDVLTAEKGQSIFNPTNLSISVSVGKPLQFRGRACTLETHVNFFYYNDSISLSQSAAASTSMLLSPSDVSTARISPESREISSLMQMGLNG